MTDEMITIAERLIGDDVVPSISARDLHAFLGSKADFTTWAKRQMDRARLVERRDYLLTTFVEQVPSGAKTKTDYFITVDAGKHIAMMSGTDRGFEVRDYFIRAARHFHQLASARATLADPEALRGLLLTYTDRTARLEDEVGILQPKAEFHDAVADAKDLQTMQEAAKVLGVGSRKIFDVLRKHRILTRDNLPYDAQLRAGRFKVVQTKYEKFGETHTRPRTMVTGKGMEYLQRELAVHEITEAAETSIRGSACHSPS